jgi:hypothetical protein
LNVLEDFLRQLRSLCLRCLAACHRYTKKAYRDSPDNTGSCSSQSKHVAGSISACC